MKLGLFAVIFCIITGIAWQLYDNYKLDQQVIENYELLVNYPTLIQLDKVLKEKD